MQPVLRFAPSPNGFLHLGHAYSALVNARIAERLGARLLLRIEDIDPLRCRPEFEEAMLEDLAWLGVRFDGPVRRQSRHMDEYQAALGRLAMRGLVYPCFCSRAETARLVAERDAAGSPWPRDPDGAPFHAGPCRDIPPPAAEALIDEGRPHAWRLALDRALAAVSGASLSWRPFDPDGGALPPVAAQPGRWGDVLLGRKEILASYHLCVVLDDAAQSVTHVVRGQDLEAATDIHVLLQRVFGLPTPVYHHHGLVLGEDGRKLSKSLASTALRTLRDQGVTPEDIRRRLGLT